SRLSRFHRTKSPPCRYKGYSRESRRLTPLEHPSSVSALRADPPSLTRGEGAPPPTPAASAISKPSRRSGRGRSASRPGCST
ncbi:MAG: hypothetical protein EOR67_07780, partial [Mesorhizobium sp.]